MKILVSQADLFLNTKLGIGVGEASLEVYVDCPLENMYCMQVWGKFVPEHNLVGYEDHGIIRKLEVYV
jgi:hypothetical protein